MKEMDEGEEKEKEGWGRRRRKGWFYSFLRSCERVRRLMSDNFTCCHTERGDHKKKKEEKKEEEGEEEKAKMEKEEKEEKSMSFATLLLVARCSAWMLSEMSAIKYKYDWIFFEVWPVSLF